MSATVMSSGEDFSEVEEEEQDSNLEDPAAALRKNSAHIPDTDDALRQQGSPRSVTRTSSSSSSVNRDFNREFEDKHQEIQNKVKERGIDAIRSCIIKLIDGCV